MDKSLNTAGVHCQTPASGEEGLISNFGRFCEKLKAERKGRGPATGDDLMLEPGKVVTFSCSGNLRGRINPKQDERFKRNAVKN